MKTKKMVISLILTFCLSATLMGCGGQASEPDSGAASGSNLEGIVTDASETTLEVKLTDGTRYEFSLEGATLDDGDNGIVVGDVVVVYYTGVLNKDAFEQDVKVTEVSVKVVAEGRLDGVLKDATTNTIDVLGGDGVSYVFDIENAEVWAGEEGLILEDTVAVFFSGALDDKNADVQQVKVTNVVVMAEPEGTLDGVVTDATTNSLTVKNSHGIVYVFDTEGAKITPGPSGLIIGDLVRVTFQGALNQNDNVQNVTVETVVVLQEPEQPSTKPKPKPEPAPAPAPAPAPDPDPDPDPKPAPEPTIDTTEHMVSGIVTAWDGSSLGIDSDDGTSLSFKVDPANIQAGSEHMGEGDNVSVYYTGVLASVSGTPMSANRVAISGWGGNYVEGFVADSGDGFVVIQIDDHNFLRFSYDSDATIGDASMDAGSYIKVFYYGSLDESLGQDTAQDVVTHGFGSAPAPANATPPTLTPSAA